MRLRFVMRTLSGLTTKCSCTSCLTAICARSRRFATENLSAWIFTDAPLRISAATFW
nr:MAG TPA: hypothetical protein [Caudoviricetes sp.]